MKTEISATAKQIRLEISLAAAAIDDNTLLRIQDVVAKCGITRAWIYILMRDGRFPAPMRVGVRAVRWRASAIDQWINEREAAGEWSADRAAA